MRMHVNSYALRQARLWQKLVNMCHVFLDLCLVFNDKA